MDSIQGVCLDEGQKFEHDTLIGCGVGRIILRVIVERVKGLLQTSLSIPFFITKLLSDTLMRHSIFQTC